MKLTVALLAGWVFGASAMHYLRPVPPTVSKTCPQVKGQTIVASAYANGDHYCTYVQGIIGYARHYRSAQ